MIFQHTIDKVLSGEKTQTRRIVKPTHGITGHAEGTIITYKSIGLWSFGNTYAVQPGRGKPAVARIRVTGLRREDVRSISHTDALAEGFDNKYYFLYTWISMHDKSVYREMLDATYDPLSPNHCPLCLYDRPADRYDAWVIEFELCKEAQS